jgi:hypothetical protein
MMPTWERGLYAAAMIATPLLTLAEDRLSATVITYDYPDSDLGQLGMLQAIHAQDRLWVLDSFVALAWGFVMIAGSVGLVKLTRRRAPRLTVATAVVLLVGAAGMCMHAVFWNIMHGSMSRAADLPAMVDLVNRTEAYPPFLAALASVIVFANAGLVLAAVALWRSRTVPWWAAACALVFPLNDHFGGQGWTYVVSCVLWTLGWGMAAIALVRRHDEEGPAAVDTLRDVPVLTGHVGL